MSFWWRCLRVIRKNEAHSIQPLICKVDSVFVIVVAIKTHLQRLLPTAYLFFPSYKTICCSSRMSTSVAKSNHNHVLSFFCCWITTQTLPYALSFKAELEERDWRGKKTFADSWNSIAKLKMRRLPEKNLLSILASSHLQIATSFFSLSLSQFKTKYKQISWIIFNWHSHRKHKREKHEKLF